jgi:hypothetical protein
MVLKCYGLPRTMRFHQMKYDKPPSGCLLFFWVVTPCGRVGRYQRFGDTRTCCGLDTYQQVHTASRSRRPVCRRFEEPINFALNTNKTRFPETSATQLQHGIDQSRMQTRLATSCRENHLRVIWTSQQTESNKDEVNISYSW